LSKQQSKSSSLRKKTAFLEQIKENAQQADNGMESSPALEKAR
jgi:hypothetical protein